MTRRRFISHNEAGEGILPLQPDHPAMVEARSLFQSRVKTPTARDRVLKSGAHSRKLGGRTRKGFRFWVPIFTHSHEERRTCPATCPLLAICYMDQTPFADRWVIGPEFFERAARQAKVLSRKYPDGWIWRVHTGGDFADVTHVNFYARVLSQNPPLMIFLFTAHSPDSLVGRRLREVMNEFGWRRFNVRFSNRTGEGCANVVWEVPSRATVDGMVVCPAMVPKPGHPGKHQTECCASCGICWNSRVRIVFPVHRKLSTHRGGHTLETGPITQ
jgi:hypothetical protein